MPVSLPPCSCSTLTIFDFTLPEELPPAEFGIWAAMVVTSDEYYWCGTWLTFE